MSELKAEITKWLFVQPNWMQESAERLFEKGELHETDIRELTALLKTEEGQKNSKHRSFSDLAASQTKGLQLRLVSIGEVNGIDMLSPRNPLTFGDGNLAVVYGRNGSGKSGYARILKKVCGKPRAKELRSNVFDEQPKEQGCKIDYELNDQRNSIKWNANDSYISDLGSVDIFDGDEAEFYLTGETNVSYTPPEVLLFEKLAQVCDRMRLELQDQQDKLVSKMPILPSKYSTTNIGNKYNSITASISETELAELIKWTEENQKKLGHLKERLKENDPSKVVANKRRRKQTLDQILAGIKSAQNLLDDTAVDRLKTLKSSAVEKRKNANQGAKAQTQTAKLEGIGTETWRALWEAAKEYSINEAYSENEFPVVGSDALCVLCHQGLNEDSSRRLQDFDEFVKGKLESEAKMAEEEIHKAIDKLPSIPNTETLELQCHGADIDEKQIENVRNYWANVNSKVSEVSKAGTKVELKGLNSPQSLLESLEISSKSLQDQINQYKIDAKEFNRQKIEHEILELEVKNWASQQKESIDEEVKRLIRINEFKSWKGMSNSRGVSIQAGKISEKAITKAYIKRFNTELKELGAKRIQVQLVKTRIERGRTMHKIKLKDVEQNGSNTTAVLSEGERRIVSLAAFLADVVGRSEPAPFVFDDPISSLDNDFEWEVAIRLAKLATERQVIVLTHRLSLYGVLEDAEKAIRHATGSSTKNLEQICIESFSGSTGHPVDEQVWTQNTTKANNTLIEKLNQAKKYWDSGDSTSYKIHAQALCSDFRKLIERTVEDDLLHQIVKRHRRKVMTHNKLTGLVTIKKEDCQFIDELMTKYSKFEHSQSEEMPTEVPDESSLREDMEALKTWRTKFKKRTL